jgi:hypothetical protein
LRLDQRLLVISAGKAWPEGHVFCVIREQNNLSVVL